MSYDVPSGKGTDLLGPEQMDEFVRDGYTIIRAAVPDEALFVARRNIARSLGADPVPSPLPRFITSCPELTQHPSILSLYSSHALPLAHALIGTPTHRIHFGQIALRHPGSGCIKAEGSGVVGRLGAHALAQHQSKLAARTAVPGAVTNPRGASDLDYTVMPNWFQHYHIDGWPSPLKPEQRGVENFTLLVGVMLSDAEDDLMGNMTVFPGGHLVVQNAIREVGGAEQLFMLDGAEERTAGASAGDGFQAASVRRLRDVTRDLLAPPVQLKLRRGDVLLMHYELPHCVAPNVSDEIRQCVYFRVHGNRHTPQQYRPEALTNVWLDFPAVSRHLGLRDSDAWKAPTNMAFFEGRKLVASAKATSGLNTKLRLFEQGIERMLEGVRAEQDPTARAAFEREADAALTEAERVRAQVRAAGASAYPGQ
jgi:hypothetical protein